MNNVSIGDILFCYNEHAHTVTKVGRKYFETDIDRHDKYHIDTLTRVSDYSTGRKQLYKTIYEVLEQKEKRSLLSELESLFSWRLNKCLNLNELRRVKEIVNHHINDKK